MLYWVMIGTDGIGSCKSNYHTITTTTLQIENKVKETHPNMVLVVTISGTCKWIGKHSETWLIQFSCKYNTGM